MRDKWIQWTLFIALCLIWGSSFILMKISKDALSGTQIAALRIFSASLVLLPFAVLHLRHVSARQLPLLFVTGLFGNLLPAILYATAIAHNLDSSLAGILNSLTPLCVILLGVLVFGDHTYKNQVLGVLTGFAGLCLLMLRDHVHLDNLIYGSLILVATLSYGININLVSHYLPSLRPVHVATISVSLMALPAGLLLAWEGFFQLPMGDPVIRQAAGAACLLGFGGTAVATLLFYMLIKRGGGLFASLVAYGIPLVAVWWGVIYGEAVGWYTVTCLGIILAGVYLARK
ncbi:MAG TPA: DMT family transporter [Chitinophagaceae bacterium]|nr:DMT family transporter [Chitinophagaceae bacterium]